MERRNDIRAAMQSLLSPARRHEAKPIPYPGPTEVTGHEDSQAPLRGNELILTESQRYVLCTLQTTLNEHGIAAEQIEIVRAMLDALLARPSLCQGLLAAYLLE